MRAVGKFLERREGSYTSKTGEVIKQLDVIVLTTETELATIRATGPEAIAELMDEVGHLDPMDAVDLGCDSPREFGGRMQWRYHA